MKATLEAVRARPRDVDVGDALALHACLIAERCAVEAYSADHSLADAMTDVEHYAAAEAAAEAMAEADEAAEVATAHVRAALAARDGGDMDAWLEGPASAASGGYESEGSDEGPAMRARRLSWTTRSTGSQGRCRSLCMTRRSWMTWTTCSRSSSMATWASSSPRAAIRAPAC